MTKESCAIIRENTDVFQKSHVHFLIVAMSLSIPSTQLQSVDFYDTQGWRFPACRPVVWLRQLQVNFFCFWALKRAHWFNLVHSRSSWREFFWGGRKVEK